MSARLQFVVFSFNRGRFLEHCVQTLELCAPQCPVLIFDDDSDDPETREVLERLGARYPVLTPRPTVPGDHSKHGGLYANMQAALDGLDDDVLMCTLQDDMQLVRPLQDSEIDAMAALLDRDDGRRFLHHAFLKGAERHHSQVRFVAEDNAYYAGREHSSAGSHYSDIFIARVRALRAVHWRFLPRESANEQQARQVFLPMAHWRDPFAAWLPAATAWRGKKRTWALRQGEKRHRCGFHPFRIMDEQQVRHFLSRNPAVRFPWAEDWLTLERDGLPQPWVYHPLQGSRWLKWLNSLELKLGGF